MENILILIALFFSSLVGQTIGFGGSLILIPLIGLIIGDIQTAIIFVGFYGFLFDIFKLINYWRFIDKEYVKYVLVTGIPGVIIGALLISIVPVRALEIILGIFIIYFIIYKIINILRNNEKIVVTKDSKYLIITGGFSYGILGGLIGSSGPINVAMLERTGHFKESFIGNFAASALPLGIIRVSIYLSKDLFPTQYLLLYFIGLIVIFLTSKIGKYITPKMPKKEFEWLVLILLIGISIKLLMGME